MSLQDRNIILTAFLAISRDCLKIFDLDLGEVETNMKCLIPLPKLKPVILMHIVYSVSSQA